MTERRKKCRKNPFFSEQAEQFATVVNALIQGSETRAEFAKSPLAVLQKYGVTFKDPTVAKRVEAELKISRAS